MSNLAYPTPTSPLYELALDFMRGANHKDISIFERLLAEDFSSKIWPSSLNPPGQEERTSKRGFIDRSKQFIEAIFEYTGYDLDHPVNVVEGKDVIVLQLRSNGKLKSGREWAQDHAYIIRFNADQKITSVDSWNDSAYTLAAFSETAFPSFTKEGPISNLKEVVKQKE